MKFLLHLSCIFPACLAKCVDFLASQYINDDYCDCSDGTDETLTNACNNGYFTCSNIGHKSISISSFKLNDDFCGKKLFLYLSFHFISGPFALLLILRLL